MSHLRISDTRAARIVDEAGRVQAEGELMVCDDAGVPQRPEVAVPQFVMFCPTWTRDDGGFDELLERWVA